MPDTWEHIAKAMTLDTEYMGPKTKTAYYVVLPGAALTVLLWYPPMTCIMMGWHVVRVVRQVKRGDDEDSDNYYS